VSEAAVRIGQIGFGYWGPNLLRNMQSVSRARVVAVADLDERRLAEVPQDGSPVGMTRDHRELFSRADIDAVVIATPAASHGELAYAALCAGKHVLVEKPLATTVEDAARLIALASRQGLILMVGHTFLYSAAVRCLKQYLEGGELGKVFYLYSQRVNLGRVCPDVNTLWNSAPHDVSILLYLMGQMPVEVVARGFAYLRDDVEDVVFMTLSFPRNVGAHIHVSWLDPHKVRRLTLIGSRKMAVYDDVSSDARIVLYDRGVDRVATATAPGDLRRPADLPLRLRSGEVTIPVLTPAEPLRVECAHFVECILEGRQPLTDGQHGLDVVRVLTAAQHSLDKRGAPVAI
jgi:predicted dehydrogenase